MTLFGPPAAQAAWIVVGSAGSAGSLRLARRPRAHCGSRPPDPRRSAAAPLRAALVQIAAASRRPTVVLLLFGLLRV